MRHICAQLWRAPVLNWDGRVTGCCRNFWDAFGGNAFTDGLEEVLNGEAIGYAREMLMGRKAERAGLPCSQCDLYRVMRRDRTWIAEEEAADEAPPILCSIVADSAASSATHADVFLAPGHSVNRALFVQPPRAARLELGRSFAAAVSVASPGPYTVYALPRRLDPSFRAQPARMDGVTRFIHVEERPAAQEFQIEL
jgi:hypothetical protein